MSVPGNLYICDWKRYGKQLQQRKRVADIAEGKGRDTHIVLVRGLGSASCLLSRKSRKDISERDRMGVCGGGGGGISLKCNNRTLVSTFFSLNTQETGDSSVFRAPNS